MSVRSTPVRKGECGSAPTDPGAGPLPRAPRSRRAAGPGCCRAEDLDTRGSRAREPLALPRRVWPCRRGAPCRYPPAPDSMEAHSVEAIIRTLNSAGVRYLVAGGLAVGSGYREAAVTSQGAA